MSATPDQLVERVRRLLGEELDDRGRHLGRKVVVGEALRGVQHRRHRERRRASNTSRLANLRQDLSLHRSLGEGLHDPRQVPEEVLLLDGILERQVVQERRSSPRACWRRGWSSRRVSSGCTCARAPSRGASGVILQEHLPDVVHLPELIGPRDRASPVHLLDQAPQPPRRSPTGVRRGSPPSPHAGTPPACTDRGRRRRRARGARVRACPARWLPRSDRRSRPASFQSRACR